MLWAVVAGRSEAHRARGAVAETAMREWEARHGGDADARPTGERERAEWYSTSL